MITLSELSLSFGNRVIFDELSATFQETDRVGLVGRNGYGKSTLLKVIAGELALDGGYVYTLNGKRLAYLNQEVVVSSDLDPIDFVVQESLKDDVIGHTPEALIRAEADKILRGLGFKSDMLQKPINTLSGGWKMRVVLAQLLLLKADFYLFDEPTNHLDIVAKDWFLNFLRYSPFGFLLVCHEKYFLNALCTKIFALDTPQGKIYKGNYDDYLVRMQADRQALEGAYVQQQKMIKQKKETIARFKASSARASQAQSMMKELDSLVLIELPDDPSTMHIPLPPIKPSGAQVVFVDNLSGGYEADKPIFSGVDFLIQRGEKVAIVAANGVGKTTLLYTISDKLKPFKGSVKEGYNVTSAMFYQEQAQVLNMDNTIWKEVTSVSSGMVEGAIRAFLGSFLFSGDDIHKKISVLSGGEKSRVGMIKVLLQQANFLLLDEPTNHLDIPSKDILLKALKNYSGTIVFVSHDRDFINKLATSIIELTPQGTVTYAGNYDDYLTQKEYSASLRNAR